MDDLDPDLEQAIQAQHEQRYDDALRHLQAVSGRVLASAASARVNLFMTMFTWRMLSDDHAPARAALAGMRDEQAARVLNGDFAFASGRVWPGTRFQLVADMHRIIGESRATWQLFVALEALSPEQARREAPMALPAIVEAGDFERAARYLPPDPLERLDELNETAQHFPLFPPDRSAPRLAADLSNFMKDVRLRAATWEGLGRDLDAKELRDAALAGLASDAMRALAQDELAEPGAIMRALSAHQMALDEGKSARPSS